MVRRIWKRDRKGRFARTGSSSAKGSSKKTVAKKKSAPKQKVKAATYSEQLSQTGRAAVKQRSRDKALRRKKRAGKISGKEYRQGKRASRNTSIAEMSGISTPQPARISRSHRKELVYGKKGNRNKYQTANNNGRNVQRGIMAVGSAAYVASVAYNINQDPHAKQAFKDLGRAVNHDAGLALHNFAKKASVKTGRGARFATSAGAGNLKKLKGTPSTFAKSRGGVYTVTNAKKPKRGYR